MNQNWMDCEKISVSCSSLTLIALSVKLLNVDKALPQCALSRGQMLGVWRDAAADLKQ